MIDGLLTTADIGKRLGISPIVSTFITDTLCVQPTKRHGRSVYWTEAQFQTICQNLAYHAERMAKRYVPKG